MNKDTVITCAHCGQQFVWTSSEQEFYASKNLTAPTHCLICRSLLKSASADQFRGKDDLKKKE